MEHRLTHYTADLLITSRVVLFIEFSSLEKRLFKIKIIEI